MVKIINITLTLSIKSLIVLDRHVLLTYVNAAFNFLQPTVQAFNIAYMNSCSGKTRLQTENISEFFLYETEGTDAA